MVDYLLEGIEFSDITVLDAATIAGNTTLNLAKKMAEVDSKRKIISVDIDPETFPDVKNSREREKGKKLFPENVS